MGADNPGTAASEEPLATDRQDQEARPAAPGGAGLDPTPNGGPDTSHSDEKKKREAETSRELGFTAGAITLFLFIRLLAVSGWEWGTAADIADSFNFDDAVSIALGTLFELPGVTGVIISVILPLAIFRIYWSRDKATIASQFKNVLIIATLGVTLFVLVNSFGMWWPVVASAVLTGLLVIADRIWRNGRGHKLLAALGRHTGLLFLGSIFALALLVDTPWMPREAITTQDGVVYGHVLEASPGFLKVLTDDREVIILLDANVVKRETVEQPHRSDKSDGPSSR